MTDKPETASEAGWAEYAALREALLPFAGRPFGSLRIDMSDVRVIISALDAILVTAEVRAALAAAEGRS